MWHHARRFLFSTLFALLPAVAAMADPAPLPAVAIVDVNNAPPYRVIRQIGQRTEYAGLYIDVVKSLAVRLGVTLEFREVPFRRALDDMEKGKADLMLGPNRTPAREAFMIYLNEPLPRERKVFFVPPGAPDIVTLADLNGRQIGVLRGAVYFPAFDTDAKIRKRAVNRYEVAFRMVAKGRLDGVIVPELLGNYLVRSLGVQVKKATFVARGQPSYITVSRRSPWAAQVPRLEAELRRMRRVGALARMMGRY